jgi:hypothetical protein
MLHGKGNQFFLTEKYEEKRQKGLEDRTRLTSTEITIYGISGTQGTGKTKDETYQIDQTPFPIDNSIRKKLTVDIRIVDPTAGGY